MKWYMKMTSPLVGAKHSGSGLSNSGMSSANSSPDRLRLDGGNGVRNCLNAFADASLGVVTEWRLKFAFANSYTRLMQCFNGRFW